MAPAPANGNLKLKIVLIGAGSAVFGLSSLATLLRSKRLRGAEVWLVDIDEAGLETMNRLAEKMNQAWDARMSIHSTTHRRQALPGADFVVVSVQVGPREDVWELDWRIPLRHGIRQPYAENSGPGAFAHTARNLPLILAIARDMEELCPEAWYLNFTNPLIRLTWAVTRYTRIKAVGLCHQLIWAYAMAMAVLGEDYGFPIPEKFNVHTDHDNMASFIPVAMAGFMTFDIKAAGINHFSWMYDIRERSSGRDLYPRLRQRWLNDYRRDFEPLTRELFEIFGMLPTPGDSHVCEYLPWVHDPQTRPWEKYDLKLQNWEGNRRRRAERYATAHAILRGEVPVDELKNAVTEGLPEIIEAVTFNDNFYHHQLNLPNNGCIPNLPADAIVEVPGIISAAGLRGLNMPPLPEPVAELCRRELAYSSLVVDACYHGSRELALQALLLDPMVNDIDTARAVLDDFLTTFAEYLPQFQAGEPLA
jgi:alpha-galactosidase